MSESSLHTSDKSLGVELPRTYLTSILLLILSLPTGVLAEQIKTSPLAQNNDFQLPIPAPQLGKGSQPTSTSTPQSSSISANPSDSQILLLGLIVNNEVVVESIRVRGREDGEKAIDFDNWLVPLEDLRKPLKLEVFDLPGGGIEVAAPTIKGRYRPINFSTDPQLGIVISIRDIQTIIGSPVTFDLLKYALVLKLPDERQPFIRPTLQDPSTLTDGLPPDPPQRLTISAIEQKVNVTGGDNRDTITNGEFRAVGNLFDTSWYLRTTQPTLDRPTSWNIAEATIIRQQPQSDLILGSQTPFWRRRGGSGTYWGLTHIDRRGFSPPSQNFGSDFLATDRLQSRRVGRSISGQAVPGSIVRLVKGGSLDPLDEVLVDSSGIFRFDNVIVAGSNQEFFGQDYRLLIYPKGELLTNPEIRQPQFTTTPGQLPKGASALVVSGGGNRVTNGTFGNFTEYQGGALYRQGLSESLTVGIGAAHDRGFLGIGEVFWQPNNIPLEASLFTAAGTTTDFAGRISYRPSADFSLNANTDNTSTRTDLRWRLNSNLALTSNYDTLRGLSGGVEYLNSSYNSSTFLRATIDDQTRTKVFASQRLDRWQANFQSNEANILGQLSYQLTDAPNSDVGHRLTAGYQFSPSTTTSSTTNSNNLTSLAWQYRSPSRTTDGSYVWQSELGYSWSNLGSGAFANADVAALPGWRLRGSYRGINENSTQSDFSVSLVTTLQIDGGIRGTDTRLDELRSLGRIELSAFIDTNQNGVRDAGEQSYWDPLLVKINQSDLNYFRTQTENNISTVSLAPGSYRIDIDPAGYPPNYRTVPAPRRVDVVASDTTRIAIPLTPSYVVTGILKDQNGNPLADTRIEIISADGKFKADSVTNNAGVFYLEGLGKGEYQFKVNSFPVSPASLKIDVNTQTLQEINLTIQIPAPQTKEESSKALIPEPIEDSNSLSDQQIKALLDAGYIFAK
jgi:Carboxypeptidase regulatory-like domain